MGQDQSVIVSDGTPPQTLSARTLAAAAELVKSGKARRIVVMTGAGISTAAGIPDFRSPNTGLYANLARLNLPYAEAVFDISYFRQHPEPFYVLARELYPGNYKPTVSHVFIALLARKGLLHMLFTQNIDCLEREAGVPPDLIVEAHGSFATQRCIECRRPYPDGAMRDHVMRGEVPRCEDAACGGLVKPDIVFFGEQLPERFHQNRGAPEAGDLALVLGTSLSVQPFALLPELVPAGVPRVLFNLERVGGLGGRPDDVLCLGDCDTGVRRFADALGWRDELEAEWRRLVGDDEAERQLRGRADRKEALRDEVSQLAGELETGLALSPPSDEGGGRGGAAGGDAVADADAITGTGGGDEEAEQERPRAAAGEQEAAPVRAEGPEGHDAAADAPAPAAAGVAGEAGGGRGRPGAEVTARTESGAEGAREAETEAAGARPGGSPEGGADEGPEEAPGKPAL